MQHDMTAWANRPIGIFDSGVGGLTVANAVVHSLPNEDIIYFGDTAHLPYGEKSAGAIQEYSERITRFLIDQGCKIILIACNSASAAAYDSLKETFQDTIPILNVIDPLVDEIARKEYREVGILATKATISSRIYDRKLAELSPTTRVISLSTPLLVPMIEEGFCNNNISEAIITNYIHNPMFDDIDAMMLCCTHYPLIRSEIERLFPRPIKVYDNSAAMADRLEALLRARNGLNTSGKKSRKFFVSDYTKSFEQTTRLFYGETVTLQLVDIH